MRNKVSIDTWNINNNLFYVEIIFSKFNDHESWWSRLIPELRLTIL